MKATQAKVTKVGSQLEATLVNLDDYLQKLSQLIAGRRRRVRHFHELLGNYATGVGLSLAVLESIFSKNDLTAIERGLVRQRLLTTINSKACRKLPPLHRKSYANEVKHLVKLL